MKGDQVPIARSGNTLLMLKSDKDTFSIDDVTMDLSYGFYDIDELEGRYNGDIFHFYPKLEGYKKPFFCMYVWEEDGYARFSGITEPGTDYKQIENRYFIKEFSFESVWKREYGYGIGFFNSITFKHKEKFTFPKEVFSKERGEIVMAIVPLYEDLNIAGQYQFYYYSKKSFLYKFIDKETIQVY